MDCWFYRPQAWAATGCYRAAAPPPAAAAAAVEAAGRGVTGRMARTAWRWCSSPSLQHSWTAAPMTPSGRRCGTTKRPWLQMQQHRSLPQAPCGLQLTQLPEWHSLLLTQLPVHYSLHLTQWPVYHSLLLTMLAPRRGSLLLTQLPVHHSLHLMQWLARRSLLSIMLAARRRSLLLRRLTVPPGRSMAMHHHSPAPAVLGLQVLAK